MTPAIIAGVVTMAKQGIFVTQSSNTQSTNDTIPTTNKGIALKFNPSADIPFKERIEITEKPIPALRSGQVLIKMLATPINPSDLVYLMGKYGLPPQDGAYVGFEGAGVVVAANAGMYGRWLIGKRVAISAEPGNDGVWAQYAITRANLCLPVRKELTDAQAATLIVNPCTSVCLVDRAKALGAKAVVLNAAASQVGKGVIRYAKMHNIKTIATVRSKSNVDTLKALGADAVVLTTAEDYQQQLKDVCHQLKARVLLDAVADIDTPTVMSCMPKHSTAIVYGRLTETQHPIGGQFSVADVIFRTHKIEGFWLATYFGTAKPWQVLSLSRKVQQLFAEGIFDTDIFGEYDFHNFTQGLEHYAVNKSDGKVILHPNAISL
ncbi:zinc-binding dehydrogenase [Thalassotalea litorea]|uniref:Zinc-binding dehydrogenase n=1 Tax=Thalassotalea litorea TaxID=2020715 RepID=A0A5R9IGE4_9GAMM|nr:zinc-binding dehydrogenase [Thalassotalea litorea]TLU64604.1 zinc-binding dehydrogenase [Thalassotalea litorea]